MNNRINLEDIDQLLETFSPMIKKKLKSTSYQEREDLEQELRIKIFEKARLLTYQETPGFWEFILKNLS
ncbi:sigma-O factor regulator RsoA [Priestia aryabhattai]|uniref:sigma-O factor regulator RsoA n=1 Tax=Priestia aryabhattai TaxID=412384 RepID=UPI003BB4FF59